MLGSIGKLGLGHLGVTKEDTLTSTFGGKEFTTMNDLLGVVGQKISALPAGNTKDSFQSQWNVVNASVSQIWNHFDWSNSPTLFQSEYDQNMATLKYLDQEISRRNATPTVVPNTPDQPAQDLTPFTPDGGSTPLPQNGAPWMSPSVKSTIDSGSTMKTVLVVAGIGIVGYLAFKFMGGKHA